MLMLAGGGGELAVSLEKVRSDFSLFLPDKGSYVIEVTWLGLPDERPSFGDGAANYLNFRDSYLANPILFMARHGEIGVPSYLEVKGCNHYFCTNGFCRWFKIRAFRA